MSIPRFLLPRGEVYLRDVHLCNRLLATTTRRYATAPYVNAEVETPHEGINFTLQTTEATSSRETRALQPA